MFNVALQEGEKCPVTGTNKDKSKEGEIKNYNFPKGKFACTVTISANCGGPSIFIDKSKNSSGNKKHQNFKYFYTEYDEGMLTTKPQVVYAANDGK